ncbi:DEAD/DEAH box helicase [bacterium]|nr:DEAD/DEAH box helicase [bacterium]MBU3956025.1 DEAD/DEAH box helicase [bacterium]
MKFDQFNLDPRLSEGINRSGFDEPTPVQKQVIPLAMAGHDLVGTAQTGTGKTAAFVLPILHKLLQDQHKCLSVLIITPTRELAEQINQNIDTLKYGTGLRNATVYGGVNANSQIKALRRGVDIIVACPGRLLDLINQEYVKLNKVDVLVLDEADRMLDMGFLPDIKRIIAYLPAERQTMMFSATFAPEIELLAKKVLHNPKRIAIGMSAPAHTVSHALFPVPQHLKSQLLLKLLEHTDTKSVLIFTRTKYRAKTLARKIESGKYTVTSLHSNRTQGQRQEALKGFKDGTYHIMVATDIAARGLDVESISHVINFDIPGTPDDYIHRIGRTGRAERTGDAFTLITPEDEPMILRLEKIIGAKIIRKTMEDFDYGAPKPKHQPSSRRGNNQPRRYGQRANPANDKKSIGRYRSNKAHDKR